MKEEKTLESVTQEYYQQAIQIGHKYRLKEELKEQIAQIELDIQSHHGSLKRINKLALELQAKEEKKAKEPETPTHETRS